MQYTGTLTTDQLQAIAAILEERLGRLGLKAVHQTSELVKALEAFKPVEKEPANGED